MKYAVLSGNERFEIREGELKSNGCAVLQVTHVGVCGTDTSYWHEGERYRGVVIGHEYSGVVVAPGTNRALKPEFYMRATAVGLPHAQFPLDYERLVLKQVLLRGSKGHNFDEFKTVINAMASGRISVKKYISRRIKLEEVQAGFEAMKAARGLDTKVIIETQ